MYDREIEDTVYEFGVSGKLIMNVLVMYDRQTQSYWSQLLGEAVEGELHGTRLEAVPAWQTTWSAWREQFPNTVALDKRGGYSRDTYESYYNNDDTGIIPETLDDDRLPTKEFIVGVAIEEQAVAYSFSSLEDDLVVNDTIEDTEVLVVFIPEGDTGLVYNRTVDEQTLTFTLQNGALIDEETGSTWDMWLGVATSGELEGERLRRISSTRSFWFGWKDWYPDTRVY